RILRRARLRARWSLSAARSALARQARRPADRTGDRRRAWLRDQWRPRRAGLPRPSWRALGARGEPARRALRQPVGLRAHPALEPVRDRSEPLVPERKPGRRVGCIAPPRRALARALHAARRPP